MSNIYFCGHSLGLQARSVESVVNEELRAWRDLAVRGHFEGKLPWMDYNDRLSQPLAELTGADPTEIVVMNTLSVNLHLLMVSFYRPQENAAKSCSKNTLSPRTVTPSSPSCAFTASIPLNAWWNWRRHPAKT